MLPITRLTLTIHQQDDLRLPEHAGSMLRGAFGMALKKLACITRQKDCTTCPLYRSCAYTQIFETPAPVSDNPLTRQTANPYVIQVPEMGSRLIEAGETWQFGFNLVGKAIDQLPLIVYAWQRAWEGGFSKAQSRAKLISIHQGEHLAYQPDSTLNIVNEQVAARSYGNTTVLRFTSPLRLQHEGQIVLVREELTASLLLMSLVRRVQKLLDLHTHNQPKLDFIHLKKQAELIELDTSTLQRMDITRYSNRQQQFIELDGLMGDIVLHGNVSDFSELLTLGEHIHVGKTATHGLGQYIINPA